MSKTKKNNRSPESSSSSRSCSSPSPSSATFTTTTSSSTSGTSACSSAESMRLIHNNLHNLHQPNQQQQLISRMTTVRRLLTIAFLLLLICAVSLFSLHQILQILAHQQQQNTQAQSEISQPKSSPNINAPPPPPPPLPLSKAEPLLYRALLQKTATLSTLEQKRAFIRSMAREAWTAYTRLAWGHEALRPLTGEPYDSEDWWQGSSSSSSPSANNQTTSKNKSKVHHLSGRTIVSAASTLWLLGLQHEYQQARNWIATQLRWPTLPPSPIPTSKLGLYFAVGETLGGLLACYALTGDLLFLDKAVAVASALKPAYSAPKGLLYSDLLESGSSSQLNQTTNYPEVANAFLWLASQNQEYLYLVELTGGCEYGRRVAEMRARIWQLLEEEGAGGGGKTPTLETNYLLHFAKAFRQSAGDDYEAARFYSRSLGRLKSAGVLRRSRSGLLYVRELASQQQQQQSSENENENNENNSADFMDGDSCCLASLVALGSRLQNGTVLERDLSLAAALVETCHQAARRSALGLPPARFYFNERDDATNQYGDAAYRYNLLGPELAEAYFLLYRLTRNGKYQAYAWELAQAIQRHCRTDLGAYTVLANVEQSIAHYSGPAEVTMLMSGKESEEQGKEVLNRQPSYFIGATLKYLYLIFSEEEALLPLEQWTFNALGQPLPIKRSKVGSRCAKVR